MQEHLLAVTQVQGGQEVIQAQGLQVVTLVAHQEVIQGLVPPQEDQEVTQEPVLPQAVQEVTQGLALLQVDQEVILLAPEVILVPSLL